MPTCKHKPCAVLPAFKGEIGTPKISFYPAQLWDGPEGRWRIMIGDRWVRRSGESRSFFTLDGVTSLVMDHLRSGLGLPVEQPGILPDTKKATPVTFVPQDPGEPLLNTWTRTEPFKDQHGEWRVWVFHKQNPVLLDDLAPREDRRAA